MSDMGRTLISPLDSPKMAGQIYFHNICMGGNQIVAVGDISLTRRTLWNSFFNNKFASRVLTLP